MGLVLAAGMLFGDAGVLIPADKEQPDPAIFALQEMAIDILIDNGFARVRIREIFANRTGMPQEGTYHFALPEKATVSDFAVWDDVTRIPGVILERKRAGELYEQIKAQMIDPGLLQMGEREAGEASRNSLFTAKIVPVPAYSTKRVEIEYQEALPVESLRSVIAVPIHPDAYNAISAGKLTATVEVRSAHAVVDFAGIGKAYPLHIAEKTANGIKADYSGTNVALTEDFAFGFAYDPAQTNTLRVITEREQDEGFFGARALLGMPQASAATDRPRTVIAVFDTSLSMQWEKLERSFQACETLLKRLRPEDSFNLLLFNGDVSAWSPKPKEATPMNVEQALAFIRRSRISGGTNVSKALDAALGQARPDSYLVLLSDGGADEGTIANHKLAAQFSAKWKQLPDGRRPHVFAFAVGDDANLPLMRALASNNGVYEWVRSTEPMEFKLNAFLSKMGQAPVRNLSLKAEPAGNFDLVYGLEDVHFAGIGGQLGGPIPGTGCGGAVHADGDQHGSDGDAARARDRSPGAAALVGQGAGGCAAGQDRARWRRRQVDRRDHPTLEAVQVRDPVHLVPGGAPGAAAAAGDPARGSGAEDQDRSVDRVGDRAVSLRTGEAAAAPGDGGHVADALPRSGGDGGRHVSSAADSAGSGRPRVPGGEELRNREQATGDPGADEAEARAGRRDAERGGLRVGKRADDHGPVLRGRAGAAPLERRGQGEHGEHRGARAPAAGAVHLERHGRGHRPQHCLAGGAH